MKKPTPRAYRKRRRAEAEQATRRRITEAAVELHGTVGPANSTVTDVAKLAGVSRMTVYNHFPTEVDLFTACSTHWATQNPFPDPSGWTDITDPAERLVRALEELYAWYGLKEGMLGNVLRDVTIVPALAEVMEGLWSGYMDTVVGVLAHGWSPTGGDNAGLNAMIRLAVEFNAWKTLTASGLEPEAAARLMARAVAAGAAPEPY